MKHHASSPQQLDLLALIDAENQSKLADQENQPIKPTAPNTPQGLAKPLEKQMQNTFADSMARSMANDSRYQTDHRPDRTPEQSEFARLLDNNLENHQLADPLLVDTPATDPLADTLYKPSRWVMLTASLFALASIAALAAWAFAPEHKQSEKLALPALQPLADGSHPSSNTSKISPSAGSINTNGDAEQQLLQIYAEINQANWGNALQRVDLLLAQYPNFRLAHLIKGDLLLARTRPIQSFGAEITNAPQDRLRELREEALLRLRAYQKKPPADNVPRYLLQLRSEQKTAIVVDTKKSRLYVYENQNGRPKLLADYYFTQGKAGDGKMREGDQKTPLGVYHITSFTPSDKLPDLYGSGALPINYPNEWDQRQGKTGHGIWLHGVPRDTYARPPKASDGCVVLANPDFEKLTRQVQIGATPVIISDQVEWIKLDAWNRERADFLGVFENWRYDWESLNTEKYLQHYSKQFSSEGMNLPQWQERKRQVNASKNWAKIRIDNIALLRYPGKENMMVVTFDQDYRSNNLSNVMKKRQYWIQEQGQWKILFEGTA